MNKKDMMPFHLFPHHGNHYLLNIERMQAYAVDEPTAQALSIVGTESGTLCPMEAELTTLGLLPVEEKKSGKAAKAQTFPIVNLCLFLTQSCNLKCVYCYGDGGGYGTGGTMEVGTAIAAVDWLVKQSGEMKKVHIGFFGGEPFLQFGLMKEVVDYAEKRTAEVGKQVDFQCTTNGTLLDDEQIAFIRNHNLSITLSLDGPREIHNAQRPFANGAKSYDLIMPKVKKLLSVAPETLGHAVIFGGTEPQLVREALEEIGFRKISLASASQQK